MRTVKGIVLLLLLLSFNMGVMAQANKPGGLRIVIIRHAEKAATGDNLSCQGMNRALALPKVLRAKFGIPNYILVPALGQGKSTSHSRMFQTITPFAVKYNLKINTSFEGDDFKGISNYLEDKQGTAVLVWDHGNIKALAKSLGAKTTKLRWADGDFDSIWIIDVKNGKPNLLIDREKIAAGNGCSF